MSQSHYRATAQNFPDLAQNLGNCKRKQKFMHFSLFFSFFFMFPTYYGILGVIFALFLAQNFKTKVLTAQTNLLLECLVDDRARTQGKGCAFKTSPCCVFTMSSIHSVLGSPCHQFTIMVHAIHYPCHPMTVPSIHIVIHSLFHQFTMSSIHHVLHTPCHPFAMSSIHHVIHSP